MNQHNEKPYRPLPPNVTVKKSTIEGLGIFSTEDILGYRYIGVTHHEKSTEPQGYVRTPLGGFVNHSLDPNCAIIVKDDTCFLITIKFVKADTELTVDYTKGPGGSKYIGQIAAIDEILNTSDAKEFE